MPNRDLASFDEVVERHGLDERRDLSVMTIPVNRIIGSLNRWQDFDSEFRVKNADSHHQSERLDRIIKLMAKGVPLPPIHVYKAGQYDDVVDGNHRVAAAKRTGQEFIDAHVIEYLPSGDDSESSLWRERSRFEFLTGLTDIELGEIGMYPLLLHYIQLYKGELEKQEGVKIDLRSAAARWYSSIYQPVTRAIAREDLLWKFPDHSVGELFLYATHHKYVKSRLQGEELTYEEAIDNLKMESGSETLYSRIASIFRSLFITAACTNCGKCAEACPEGLICEQGGRFRIDPSCGGCERCSGVCPVPDAIRRYP